MGKQHKTVNQTFSIGVDVAEDLHAYVKPRERSRFVTDALRKELETRKEELKQQYLSANRDSGQQEASKEWLDTLVDGSNDW